MLRFLVLFLCLAPAGLDAAEPAVPARWTKALARTPDLTQTDARARLPDGGRSYCAPVAVANALMRLADEGYPRLAPLAPKPVLAHIDVVRQLAAADHMGTDRRGGTSTGGLLRGVERYLADRGYRPLALAYRGWRAHPARFGTARARPDLAWIKRRLARPASAAWINAGWYVHDEEADTYRRIGGHWVTLAGYGLDAAGEPAPDVLILRDPSPRAGTRPRFEFVRLERLASGRLLGPQRGLPRPAAGTYRLGAGMHLKPGADVALIDGVVVLALDPAQRAAETERAPDR